MLLIGRELGKEQGAEAWEMQTFPPSLYSSSLVKESLSFPPEAQPLAISQASAAASTAQLLPESQNSFVC